MIFFDFVRVFKLLTCKTTTLSKNLAFRIISTFDQTSEVEAFRDKGKARESGIFFIMDLETLIQKTTTEAKIFHLKLCIRNNQREGALKKFATLLNEL